MLDTLLACDVQSWFSSIDLDDENVMAVIFGGAAFAFLIFMTLVGTIRSVAIGRAREASRREIAAYIAEGSMTAEEGERLMNAGRPHRERWHC